jgi:hypothetical protein
MSLEGMIGIMADDKANQNRELDTSDNNFDIEEMERLLSKQLEESFSDLELLESDRNKISDPDSLGKIVLDEVWGQFSNQIGLDTTNETLIQQYDREHPEEKEYNKKIADSIMQDDRYKSASKEMKEQQRLGKLKDAYTGKRLKPEDKVNIDHVKSRKLEFYNPRRRQAGLSVADAVNKKENLQPTNEALNKSKGAKSNREYIENRKIREKELIEQNKRANKKIDESNKSDADKHWQKEKNNKRLKDKLAANDKLMMQADKKAEQAINKDIYINVTKRVGEKAGKDALKAMAVSAMFSLLKEIMNGMVRFFKTKSKSFYRFLSEMKESIRAFISKILGVLQTGASTLLGTIVSEIFGPIVSLFKKLASLIKQGVSTVVNAVNYLRDKKNRDKPFAVKIAQIGKIIVAGLVGGSAVILGDVFEKILLTIPGMQIEIPLIGTLANIIGLFLSSLISGLIGAIVLNLVDKFIAKKLKEESTKKIIDKKNKTMECQNRYRDITEQHVVATRKNVFNDIADRHIQAIEIMQKSLKNITKESETGCLNKTENISKNQNDFVQMQEELKKLL